MSHTRAKPLDLITPNKILKKGWRDGIVKRMELKKLEELDKKPLESLEVKEDG